MAIFQTPLVSLINQRLEYLSKRSHVLTENIARSDIKGAKRKDIKPFEQLVNRSSIQKKSSNGIKKSTHLSIKEQDMITFNQEIEREIEFLKLNHNSLNHQALIDVLGTLHRLYKVAIGKPS